ncbi:hypothetical protein GOA89_14785 [Sinorhizobium meliloti]|nr:hypothetical protein [Sinorhizobium meliloti]MDW9847562.1 hypothetical protein [Sinorhizobium meliloti]MDX0144055.1 hypothetical protein [Sinorhizobium meliloti]MDX0150480.1 hypothetical protein [Sinorhizobium meliloti]MDX0169740.1 hypothetical protein [Sinorhizobium meliloti]
MTNEAKGPAEAATSPSHGSTNPEKDKEMNEVHAITSAIADPARRDPLAPRGAMSFEIDMAKLRKMSMKELRDFRGVLPSMTEITAAFSSQGRFSSDDGSAYNDAGDVVHDLCEFLSRYENALINVAKAAEPTASRDVEWRAWTILGYEADCADELAPFAVIASEAVRDEAAAKTFERYAPKAGGAK